MNTHNESILDLNKEFAYIQNHPIHYKENVLPDRIINTIPMDKDWKERCKQNSWWFHDYDELPERYKTSHIKDIYKLKERLLSFAGESTNFYFGERDVIQLLERGQLWYGDRLIKISGEPSQCHHNSAIFWENNQDKCRIVTGYALSEDSMWRQHSWLIQKDNDKNIVVETTEDRILYFGFVLTTEECKKFYNDNV